MTRKKSFAVPAWSIGVPIAACLALAAAWGRPLGWIAVLLIAAALAAAVFAAVHHAEVVAHRVGEPFGSLILALAVTVIEVALIVSIMLSGGGAASTLARDAVFATVMIVTNGVVGLCLLLGAMRHQVLAFRPEGTSPALAVLVALTTLTLILPTLTTTTPGPTFSPSQLVFAGVTIALLVLLPETWAAMRDRMQTSLNLALGSALATIGLTIPAVAAVSLLLGLPLALGLPPKETALLVLTFLISALTFASGRATVLQGAVHLVLFATFLFLAVVP